MYYAFKILNARNWRFVDCIWLTACLCLSSYLSFFRWSDLCFIHQSGRHGRRMMGVGLYLSFSSSLTLRNKQTHLLLKISACAFCVREEDRGNHIVPFWEMKWWLPRYDMMSICRFCRQPTNNCSLFISISLSLSQQHYSAMMSGMRWALACFILCSDYQTL